jgi:hypothetical protein
MEEYIKQMTKTVMEMYVLTFGYVSKCHFDGSELVVGNHTFVTTIAVHDGSACTQSFWHGFGLEADELSGTSQVVNVDLHNADELALAVQAQFVELGI